MRDLVLERLHDPHRLAWLRRRGQGRCPICGCVPGVQQSHRVVMGLPYDVLVTCESRYCRTRDDVRYPPELTRGAETCERRSA